MNGLSLCSSNQVIRALQRAGFRPSRQPTGSHQAFERVEADGTRRVAIVVLGKREVPRGALRSILRRAGLILDEFRALLR